MMRATTLKASGSQLAKVIGYYAGLAEDQLRRDGISRGPVDYYVDPHEPPGRWWGGGCEALGLPAVGRGGMFEQWCETVPAHHLDDVRRFADHWQGPASLDLRKGKPEAVEAYAVHHCLDTVHPSVVADRVARRHEELTHGGQSLAITCASSSTARTINVAIQHRRNRRQVGPSLALRDRTRVFVGDTVATRHNDSRLVTTSGATVRNRHT